MPGTTRRTTLLIGVLTMMGVPFVMLLVYLTHGAIEPHLPGQSTTWNIQYSLHLTTAIVAALLALRFRRILGKMFWIILIWNCLWTVLAVYAIVSLWGDMY